MSREVGNTLTQAEPSLPSLVNSQFPSATAVFRIKVVSFHYPLKATHHKNPQPNSIANS